MIVDDDVHWRRFPGRHFRAPRWSVMPFSDPENALVYVQARGAELDLVVADFRYPFCPDTRLMSGIRDIRDRHPSLPLVIYSMVPDQLPAALAVGPTRLIDKDISRNDLLLAIAAALGLC